MASDTASFGGRHLAAAAMLLGVALATGSARADGDAAKGEAVFRKCKACHTLEAGAKHRIGPNLHGVLGRKAGGAEGFKYSQAMQESGIVWDEETLDGYLADPKGFIPKNKMAFAGIKDAQERADVISYLEEATK
jgi:cytochrome c